MARIVAHLVVFLFVVAAATSGAMAETRIALVIGNSSYRHVATLPNPKNDAEDLAEVLERVGFAVTQVNDLGYDAMRRALRDFAREASSADMALVFFAGHGMEVNKHNYLIPTDARLETDGDIEYEAVPLDLVINAVNGARRLGLVMLDACRNNPFAASMKNTSPGRSVGRGLARIEPSAGTLVSYAAKEGTIADDGRGRNSPYTKALLAHLEQPGVDIQFMFRKVRDSVFKDTNGKQEPFTYGSLPGKQIYLMEPQAQTSTAPSPAPTPQGRFDREALFWSSVKDTNDPKMLEAYLDKFPDGLYAALARARLAHLRNVASLPDQTATRTEDPASIAKCHELAAHRDDPANTLGVGVSADVLTQHATSAIAACRQAVSIEPDNPRLTFQLARALHAAENFSEAWGLCKSAAEAGHVAAITMLALMYAEGQGVPRDYAEAVRLLRKTAERGHVNAITGLGLMYEKGLGVTRDVAEALRWYRKAAERGHAHAMTSLGVVYAQGNGLPRDYAEAVRLFRKAAKRGDARAMYNLGVVYQQGAGVTRNDAEAVRWFRKAAENYDASAMSNLGVMYENGRGVARDFAEAVRWYRKAAEMGNELAMTNIGFMYENGRGVSRDYAEALRWYRKAVEKGVGQAMTKLGLMYEQGNGVSRDYAEAVHWYRKAAEKGLAIAMTNLAVMYRTGRGISRSYSEAAHWYRKAAENGNARGMGDLAFMYNQGLGVTRNAAEAARLVAQALKLGYEFSVQQMTTNSKNWSRDFRMELQRILKSEGYYQGAIDGSFGPATHSAIRRYVGKS